MPNSLSKNDCLFHISYALKSHPRLCGVQRVSLLELIKNENLYGLQPNLLTLLEQMYADKLIAYNLASAYGKMLPTAEVRNLKVW